MYPHKQWLMIRWVLLPFPSMVVFLGNVPGVNREANIPKLCLARIELPAQRSRSAQCGLETALAPHHRVEGLKEAKFELFSRQHIKSSCDNWRHSPWAVCRPLSEGQAKGNCHGWSCRQTGLAPEGLVWMDGQGTV